MDNKPKKKRMTLKEYLDPKKHISPSGGISVDLFLLLMFLAELIFVIPVVIWAYNNFWS